MVSGRKISSKTRIQTLTSLKVFVFCLCLEVNTMVTSMDIKDSPGNIHDSSRSCQLNTSTLLRIQGCPRVGLIADSLLTIIILENFLRPWVWPSCLWVHGDLTGQHAQLRSVPMTASHGLTQRHLWARMLISSFSPFALKRELSRTLGG